MKNESRKLLIEYLYGIKSKDSEDSEFWELLEDESVRGEYKDITLIDKEIANIAESIKPSEQLMASVFNKAGVTISTGSVVGTTGTSAKLFSFQLIPLFMTMMLITSPFIEVDNVSTASKFESSIVAESNIKDDIGTITEQNSSNTETVNSIRNPHQITKLEIVEVHSNDISIKYANEIENSSDNQQIKKNQKNQVTLSNFLTDNNIGVINIPQSDIGYKQQIYIDEPQNPIYSNVIINVGAMSNLASYNTKLNNEYASQFENFNIGIKYQLLDFLAFGIDYYQETYFLNYREYQGIIPIRDIEQYTNTSSFYGSTIVSYPVLDNFASPYLKASLGLNKFGVTDRYSAGIVLNLSDKFSTYFEYGVSNLRYTNQNRDYTSDRNNITLGIQTSLNNLGIK